MLPPKAGPDENRVILRENGDGVDVEIGGTWRLTARQPSWRGVAGSRRFRRVRLVAGELGPWDTALPLFLSSVRQDCIKRRTECDASALPERLRDLMAQVDEASARAVAEDRTESLLTAIGNAATGAGGALREFLSFVGDSARALVRAAIRPHKFRWADCFDEMQQCGAMALPIVSLIGFLVGLTLAYQGAVELRQFGAEIWVADLVGLSVVREMGPIMAAVIVAGRTGAAFAASLGNMKMNEEIDALEVLGIAPVDFLVLPRLIAVGLMMPLLCLYTDAVGILGGVVVSAGILHIPPTAYWVETESAVALTDVNSGIIKAVMFGVLIGLAGCLRGFQAERSAAGVGRAATSAVVTSVLFIIVTDAIFAVLFNVLGI